MYIKKFPLCSISINIENHTFLTIKKESQLKIHFLQNCYFYKSFYSVAIATGLASSSSVTSDCDLFEESKLCISQLHNLLGRQPIENELVCQELCQSHTRCTHFTFVEGKYPLNTGEPDFQCYLWKKCIAKVDLIQPLIGTNFDSGALLLHGLLIVGSRPHPTQHGGLLLLPIPARCL